MLRKSVIAKCVTVVIVVFITTGTSYGLGSWDLAGDLAADLNSNPNGQWDYKVEQGGTLFNLGTQAIGLFGDDPGSDGVFGWWNGSWAHVSIAGSPNGFHRQAWGFLPVDPGKGVLMPEANANTWAMWQAPYDIQVDVNLDYYTLSVGEQQVNLGIYDGATFTPSYTQGFNNQQGATGAYTTTMDVLAGQSIVLELNPLGTNASDIIGINAYSITEVPEPMTLSLLGLGGLALLRKRRA